MNTPLTIQFAQSNKDFTKTIEDLKDAGSAAGIQSYRDPELIVGNAIGVALSVIGALFLVLMVYAGFLWMTARGEESQIDKARKIIVGTAIGLFIVITAYAITVLVGEGIVR